MSFSENIKLEVKKKAAFQCCCCRVFHSIEVHHIIPSKDGGSDEIDNAAPICPNCHANFGDNPTKRKEIKQVRDWWYERVENMYSHKITNPQDIAILNNKIAVLPTKKDFGEIKNMLRNIANNTIDNLNMETIVATTSGIVTSASACSPSASPSPSPSSSYEIDEWSCPICGRLNIGRECSHCHTIKR